MTTTTIILGVGIFEFLLLALMFFIWMTSEPRGKHQPLLFAGMLMFVVGLMFIPAVVLRTGEGDCGATLNASMNGNTTIYSYDYICTDVSRITKVNIMKLYILFMIIFFVYVFLYVSWSIFGGILKKKFQKTNYGKGGF